MSEIFPILVCFGYNKTKIPVRERSRMPMGKWQVDAQFCLGLEMTESEAIELIRQLCESKANELKLYGYHQAVALDVWTCIQSRWKRNQEVTLHGLTSAIFTLKPMEWMNWLTVNTWKHQLDTTEIAQALLQTSTPAEGERSS